MTRPVKPAATAEQLLALLQRHRETLLRVDPTAIADLEDCTREVEAAFASLSRSASAAPGALAGLAEAEIARLQSELQVNQATLVQVASVNRRALNALFGEPPLYSK